MQKALANWTADTLSKQLNTKVKIESVNIGLLNRIIVNDLYVEDQSKKKMLKVARVSASINLFKLATNGNIDISSAQLFGTEANIYKNTPEDDYNFKFVIDALKTDDKESKPINLRINTLAVRHATINYDILSEIKNTTFDTNHLKIENAGFNLSLKSFTPDSINVSVRRFQAVEANSNLAIKEMFFKFTSNKEKATLSNFILKMPKSYVQINKSTINYKTYKQNKLFTLSNTDIIASLTPTDFSFISSYLPKYEESLHINTTISADNNNLEISKLSINNNCKTLDIEASAKLTNLSKNLPNIDFIVKNLYLTESEVIRCVSLLNLDADKVTPLLNAGNISYSGTLHKDDRELTSNGEINTDAGSIIYSANYTKDKILTADIETNDMNLRNLLEDENFGTLNVQASALLDLNVKSQIPSGNIEATINNFTYKDYDYKDIQFVANSNSSDLKLIANSADENINLDFEGSLSHINDNYKAIVANLDVHHFNPKALHLTDNIKGETYSFALKTDMSYSDLNHLDGALSLNDISIKNDEEEQNVNNINVSAKLDGTSTQSLIINSDFIDVEIQGRFNIKDLPSDFTNIFAHHIPALVKPTDKTTASDFNYIAHFYDAPIVHHFINSDYTIGKPITIQGTLKSADNHLNMICEAPQFTFGERQFNNVKVNCSSSRGNMILTLTGLNDNGSSDIGGKIVAIAHNNKLDTDIQLEGTASNHIKFNCFGTTSFSHLDGHLKTNINLHNSHIAINDTIWNITPSQITYCNNQLEFNKFKIGYKNQYLEVNGKASQQAKDSLSIDLNEIELGYILALTNLKDIRFGGLASGHATINNIFVKPDASVNLAVRNFTFQDGNMGDAKILAFWDNEKEGINVHANIIDHYQSQIALTGIKEEVAGHTIADGIISLGKNEMDLRVQTNNTRAEFLEGFLGRILQDVDGRINGDLRIVGPLKDINLIGDAKLDMSLKLRATKVPYFISDSIRLKYHEFDLSNITLHDKQGNTGLMNSRLTHKNFANFTYNFDAELKNLCAYYETTFNADKFMAQVWTNGDIHINGSDGHPVTINANISPTKGSMFAYDSATPDALVNNTFIDFQDITEKEKIRTSHQNYLVDAEESKDEKASKDEYKYHGDLYMNVNIDLTPNCEIKLRMDNTEDGYISTFGHGTFQAKWYNKGAFQLFGNYNITSGKYRLYLQDLVYRNLELQDGSKVEFNGNPFDANIRLLCKHEINSVPLSDLTATKAFSSNNKVKVDCFLDITGHLDKMDLSFKFELPNVSEETRQLVKSMINSEEEMNKQMIYLLGFQRFYPNELAQSTMENYGTQAVNSLISSTISGQINQVLSNMIGSSSKWNFGTGITTGENGWQDLDVEGMLSGRLLNDRLLINGNFGYRDNSLTNQANFIGDFELQYRIWETGDFYVKAYNQTNDRYFTKATLNTQGVGLSFQHDFERYTFLDWLKKKQKEPTDSLSTKK